MRAFILDHNQVFCDIKKEFEIVDKIENADIVFVWNDVLSFERGVINLARSLKKRVYAMQHGRKGSSRYYPPFNEKIYADKLFVWGEFDKTSLIKAEQDPKKIKVVGSPIFSHLKERKKHKGINIVFCPEHWDAEVPENFMTRDELRKLKGVNVITKTIDSHDSKDYDNVIQTDRDDPAHLDKCIEVLQTADLVVGVSESTFELLAQAMDIPVVIMEEWTPKPFGRDIKYLNYRRVISRAAKRTSIKDLNETIKQQLANPNELKEERRQVVIEEGGINLDTIKLIKELC